MSHKRRGFAAVAGIALATTAWATIGHSQDAAQPGAAEKTGGALDNAGRRIRRGLEGAAGSIQRGWDQTRTAVHNMGVESRIYGRLHWDKALTNAPIQLEMQAGGVAVLRGTVPDAAARVKAENLTADTVGVNQVVSNLVVAPTTPGTTTPAPTTNP